MKKHNWKGGLFAAVLFVVYVLAVVRLVYGCYLEVSR